MVRKILGCRSSGISFCRHSLFVILLKIYKINPANKIKYIEIEESTLNFTPNGLSTVSLRYQILLKKDSIKVFKY